MKYPFLILAALAIALMGLPLKGLLYKASQDAPVQEAYHPRTYPERVSATPTFATDGFQVIQGKDPSRHPAYAEGPKTAANIAAR